MVVIIWLDDRPNKMVSKILAIEIPLRRISSFFDDSQLNNWKIPVRKPPPDIMRIPNIAHSFQCSTWRKKLSKTESHQMRQSHWNLIGARAFRFALVFGGLVRMAYRCDPLVELLCFLSVSLSLSSQSTLSSAGAFSSNNTDAVTTAARHLLRLKRQRTSRGVWP